jgi:energy-coupling factor transporter transmembrane protein EcfT
MHLLLTEGEPLLKLAPLPLTVTREGLMQGAYVIWQFAALVLTAAVLTMTTLPSDLVGGIERLLRPLARVGFPSQEIAVMMSMALRFLPILLEETERLQTAMLARGADFTGGGLGRRTRSFASLAVPLLLSAFRRADDLVLAMEARGYRRGPRTTLRELRLAESDYAALAVIAAFAAANLGLRFIA